MQPLFQPGHFFAPQQVHFAAPTSSNKPSQESSKEKANEKTKPKPKAGRLVRGVDETPSSCVGSSFRKTERILHQNAHSDLECDLRGLQEQL